MSDGTDPTTDSTPEVVSSDSSAPTPDSATPPAPTSGDESTSTPDVTAEAATTEPVVDAAANDADEPEVQIAAEAAVVEAAAPAVFNIIDTDSTQFLVRYNFSNGLIIRKFVTSDEEAAVTGRVYRDAAIEKGITLLSVTRAQYLGQNRRALFIRARIFLVNS